ncbi:MAG TPA: ribosome maturation factor RimP, partial [candidate division Zixibacteria bacterium]|nr:ribosome maturation factor RimP [candidate division Zixibacteria bacterium]
MKEYLPQIESIVAPIVESRGYELVEIKVAGVGRASVLRVFVYRVGGITIDEITTLSRVISE